jgi:predicted Fe-Mo cluster-binding NifX family protein
MILCIPTLTNEGKAAPVHEHFGSAPFFTICDSATGQVEVLANSDHGHAHGMCQPLSILAGRKIDAVLCGGMGVRALLKLNQEGIRAYRAECGSVADMLEKFAAGRLEEIRQENACAHHHGCR